MLPFYILENEIKEYSWGSVDGISFFTDIENPSNKKMAELWMGAHSQSPSKIKQVHNSTQMTLLDLIRKNPEECLGRENAIAWNNSLPFLFKLLSAAQPLSLQVHPSKEQAIAGFIKEKGIAIDNSLKNYRDSNHKPEILVALTPFTALAGFREEKSLLHLFTLFNDDSLQEISNTFYVSKDYAQLLENILLLPTLKKNTILHSIQNKCTTIFSKYDTSSIEFKTFSMIKHLSLFYPLDIGVLAPLFLNIIELKPMEAIFIPAGIIHSYIEGTGIELMANSDNVLRCALTDKHVDINEVLTIIQNFSFTPKKICPDFSHGYGIYPTTAPDFEVSVDNKKLKNYTRNDLPLVLLVTSGSVTVRDKQMAQITLRKGESIFIPASTEEIIIDADGEYWAAGIQQKTTTKAQITQ